MSGCSFSKISVIKDEEPDALKGVSLCVVVCGSVVFVSVCPAVSFSDISGLNALLSSLYSRKFSRIFLLDIVANWREEKDDPLGRVSIVVDGGRVLLPTGYLDNVVFYFWLWL